MSENIASSTSFGGRPSRSRMPSYSASVSPSSRACSRPGSSDSDVPLEVLMDGGEDLQAVDRAGERVDGVLGMGHEAEDVARGAAHAGDVAQRAVGVLAGRVAQQDLTVGFQLVERLLGRVVAAGRV